MTTTVHIFNAGPKQITVKTGHDPAQTVRPNGSANVYVHSSSCVLIEEEAPPLPASTIAAAAAESAGTSKV